MCEKVERGGGCLLFRFRGWAKQCNVVPISLAHSACITVAGFTDSFAPLCGVACKISVGGRSLVGYYLAKTKCTGRAKES